jgi:hypothetical protein
MLAVAAMDSVYFRVVATPAIDSLAGNDLADETDLRRPPRDAIPSAFPD